LRKPRRLDPTAIRRPWRSAIWPRPDFLADDPDPRREPAEAVTAAAEARVDAFHEALWAEAPGAADIGLLAAACFLQWWPGLDLVGTRSDALLQEGPHIGDGESADNALAALLRPIRDQCLASDRQLTALPLMQHPLIKEANAVLDTWGDACEGDRRR
jgi:hypothetical protein